MNKKIAVLVLLIASVVRANEISDLHLCLNDLSETKPVRDVDDVVIPGGQNAFVYKSAERGTALFRLTVVSEQNAYTCFTPEDADGRSAIDFDLGKKDSLIPKGPESENSVVTFKPKPDANGNFLNFRAETADDRKNEKSAHCKTIMNRLEDISGVDLIKQVERSLERIYISPYGAKDLSEKELSAVKNCEKIPEVSRYLVLFRTELKKKGAAVKTENSVAQPSPSAQRRPSPRLSRFNQ